MAKVIIGIHGLGNKPAKDVLENWWLLSMKEGLKAIGRRQTIPKFEMIYWADLFYDAPLDERIGDINDPRYLDEPYRIAPKRIAEDVSPTRLKVMNFIGSQLKKLLLNPDLTLKHSYLTNAIGERYFHEFIEYFNAIKQGNFNDTNNVRVQIAKRVTEVIEKYEGDEIFFVSHSMGTIIAFDVLSFTAPRTEISTFITLGSPLGMPNVMSEIAELCRINGTLNSTLKTPPSIKWNWFNFSDPEDNVAFYHKLSHDYNENVQNVKPIDFIVFNNYLINGERNPHKSYGYLRCAEFANTLATFIESKQTIRQMVKNSMDRVGDAVKKLLTVLPKKQGIQLHRIHN